MTDFTEQARQLVARHRLGRTHQPTYCCPEDEPFYERRLAEDIASFAAEAATQGQVVGIERAAELLDDAVVRKNVEVQELKAVNWSTLELQHYSEALRKAAIAIRALSPDPNHLDRVRNEAATSALEQAGHCDECRLCEDHKGQ